HGRVRGGMARSGIQQPGQARPGSAAAPAGRAGGSRLYVLAALLLPVAIVMLPSFVVLAIAMVPTVVAWMVDRGGRRHLAATVCSLNLAGSLYMLMALWQQQHDLPHALEVLRDVYGWLVAYGAAAMAYALHYVMPSLADAVLRLRAERRLAALERDMAALVEEWGQAVAADPEP